MSTERNSPKLAVLGFVMMALSTPCVFAMISDLITKADNISGALIVGTFCAFVSIAGLVLMRTGLKKKAPKAFEMAEHTERQMLEIAQKHRGRITLSELAMESRLTLDECQEALNYFERKSVARTHLSDAGDVVYVFPHFDIDKSTAVDPLDDRAVFDRELAAGREDDEVVLSQPEEARQEDW